MMSRPLSGRRRRRAGIRFSFEFSEIKEGRTGKRVCAVAQKRQPPECTPVLYDQIMGLGGSARSLCL